MTRQKNPITMKLVSTVKKGLLIILNQGAVKVDFTFEFSCITFVAFSDTKIVLDFRHIT